MKQTEKIILEKAIETLSHFIKNADLSQESSIELIFGDDLNDEEIEFIAEKTSGFESFELLEDSAYIVVSTEQLEEMLSDLKSLI